MGNRRKSREMAIQALYYMDSANSFSENTLILFCRNFNTPESILPFLLKLVRGVVEARNEIDALIERFSSNWKVHRMTCVDRNVLRIAVFEMCCCDDIPIKVSINEAIDLGKKYGSDESGSFVNGILDSIRSTMEQEPIRIDISIESWERINRVSLPDLWETTPLPVAPVYLPHHDGTVSDNDDFGNDMMDSDEPEPEDDTAARPKRRTIVQPPSGKRIKR
jgi:N utilization substance protein B